MGLFSFLEDSIDYVINQMPEDIGCFISDTTEEIVEKVEDLLS